MIPSGSELNQRASIQKGRRTDRRGSWNRNSPRPSIIQGLIDLVNMVVDACRTCSYPSSHSTTSFCLTRPCHTSSSVQSTVVTAPRRSKHGHITRSVQVCEPPLPIHHHYYYPAGPPNHAIDRPRISPTAETDSFRHSGISDPGTHNVDLHLRRGFPANYTLRSYAYHGLILVCPTLPRSSRFRGDTAKQGTTRGSMC